LRTYIDLQMAFAFLNGRLFNGCLPHCLITLQRKSGAGGFFAGGRFNTRDKTAVVDEIALNPSHFAEQSDREILAILGHEICHVWQHHFGKPPLRAYHNQEWSAKMCSIGLIPSTTGAPNGRQTGAKMFHYVEPGGTFDIACGELLATGTVVTYVERIDTARQTTREKKRASKSTFVCPGCGWQVWGKPATRVRCDRCDLLLELKASD
jgi:predicted SprT family Zn-dependent metalloprotease